MAPAAAVGVTLLPMASLRWFHRTIPLALLLVLLLYLCAWSFREWSLPSCSGRNREAKRGGPKPPPQSLTARPRPSPGAVSGCRAGTQSCFPEGTPPVQVCPTQGWDRGLRVGPRLRGVGPG